MSGNAVSCRFRRGATLFFWANFTHFRGLWEFSMLAQDQPFPREGNTWKMELPHSICNGFHFTPPEAEKPG